MEPASSSAAAAASNREPALIEKHVAALRAGSGWVNPECRLPSRFIFSRPPPGLVDSSPLVRKVAMHDVYNRIHRLYTSHKPFFAKDVFRYILEQLDRWRARRFPANHVIFIPALDGSRVKVELETGTVWHHPTAVDSDVACTTGNPHLDYRTFQQMANCHPPFIPHMAYCPIRLAYPPQYRRISTGRPLPHGGREVLRSDTVQAHLDLSITKWEETDDCKRLRAVFETVALPSVTKIVAFACGSMVLRPETLDMKATNSYYQHALILTVRDALQRGRSSMAPIRCFAQDPIYTATDKLFLARAGITVLEDPRGFLEVDHETVVMSFRPAIPVRQIVADIAWPAILIWDRIRSEAEMGADEIFPGPDPHLGVDAESPRLRTMASLDYSGPFPVGSDEAFQSISVYIRNKSSIAGLVPHHSLF